MNLVSLAASAAEEKPTVTNHISPLMLSVLSAFKVFVTLLKVVNDGLSLRSRVAIRFHTGYQFVLNVRISFPLKSMDVRPGIHQSAKVCNLSFDSLKEVRDVSPSTLISINESNHAPSKVASKGLLCKYKVVNEVSHVPTKDVS